MKRKVNRVGQSTLTVSLPASWVKKTGIKQGDEIELREERNTLIISTGLGSSVKSATISIKKPNRLISRSLFNMYRKGIDEIIIRYDDKSIRKDINRYLPLLKGFEIDSETQRSTTIKSLTSINETSFENSLRRYFLVTKQLAKESYEAIRDNRYDELEVIRELEYEQNRLYMFLCRVVNKNGLALFDNSNLMYLMLQRLEDLADDYKYICNYVTETRPQKISDQTLDHYRDINKTCELLYDFYYNFNIETGKKILEEKKILIRIGLDLLTKVPKDEIRIVHILNNILVKIYETASPIFGMHLDSQDLKGKS